jgi:hypothetical protein
LAIITRTSKSESQGKLKAFHAVNLPVETRNLQGTLKKACSLQQTQLALREKERDKKTIKRLTSCEKGSNVTTASPLTTCTSSDLEQLIEFSAA